MANTAPPPRERKYNQSKGGYFGELGSGENARIKFLQTAMNYEELNKVTLIQNIPGSETWDVRDLFQRDVDRDRVTQEILPYLKDPRRIKFFNPLTLVLLPLRSGQGDVEKRLRAVRTTEDRDGAHEYDIFEVDGFFSFRVHRAHAEYSSVEWNDSRVQLVAIDGQHRLSALKRWKDEPGDNSELQSWHIPVILLGIVRDDPDRPAANVLEVVRRTFVYINTRAEQINRSRKILLNDESINALCVQELVQAAHENDVKPLEERDASRLPLLFFDWRGETRGGQAYPAPAAVKSTVELREWMEEYLLGSDGDEKQTVRLELTDLIPPLETIDLSQLASHRDSERIRERFKEILYPGLSYLLEGFTPYQQYREEVGRLEREALEGSDLAKHAFSKLRFGASVADESILEDVQAKYDELVSDLETIKNRAFPELVARDVGMRAVLGAFDMLKTFRDEREDETLPWAEFAEWFVTGLNKVFDEGWFESFGIQPPKRKKLLTHVVFDPSGSIVNYKVRDAGGALGTVLALLIVARAGSLDQLGEAWHDLSENLRVPLRRGYRKMIRAELADTFQGTATDFKKEVNRRADAQVDQHLRSLAEYLDVPKP